MLRATAEAVWQLVFPEQISEAFNLTLIGRDEEGARLLLHELSHLFEKSWNRSVKTKRGTRIERDFTQSVVFVEHINGPELIQVEAGVRCHLCFENLRADVDVLGPDKRADAGTFVALLNLVPPTIHLVLDHG